MVRVLMAFLALVASLFLVGADKDKGARSSSGGGDPEWTYRNTATHGREPYGPSDWYEDYPDCGKRAQSPIGIAAANVDTMVKGEQFSLQFFQNKCSSAELSFEANEHTWEVIFQGCSDTPYLDFKGEQYDLVQVHIHSPSEHAIGGSLHDAEIHLVHLREETDDDILVVGVLMDATEYGTNIEIQHLWNALVEGVVNHALVTRVYDLTPPSPSFYYYEGSLTTPPCTERVKWIVMSDVVLIGKMQLDLFRTSVALHKDSKVDGQGNTNRPLQPLNKREIFHVVP